MNLGKRIRKDFPIFHPVRGKMPKASAAPLARASNGVSRVKTRPFVYLDSAATSLKPKVMLGAMREYYEEYSANVARGVYTMSEKATQEYENARKIAQKFIGASRPEEIIFVRNATEGLNLIAVSYGENFLREGEGILLSEMEHHANLVPWQQLAKKKKLIIHFLPFNLKTGKLEWNPKNFATFIKSRKIKLVSLTHVSNVLGTINPVKEISKRVHETGAVLVVDGAQSVPHLTVNVKDLGCDFLVFSGHKMLGPTGIGVLWGRYELLEKMPPFLTGGEMIEDVDLKYSTFQLPPWRFEAGTPHIAGAIGLGAAIKYLGKIGMEKIRAHEKDLLILAMKKLSEVPGLSVLGSKDIGKRSGAISFVIDGIHPHDIGSFLNEEGIMIRVGDHCAKPLHKKFKIPASSRVSFYIYNEREDIEKAVKSLQKLVQLFKGPSNFK